MSRISSWIFELEFPVRQGIERKNPLVINHEFIKEAKTTIAKFEKLTFRVWSLRGSKTMLSLSINESFFRICNPPRDFRE